MNGRALRNRLWTVLACGVTAVALMAAPAEAQGPGDAALQRYAVDTWESFVAMTDPQSGLPTDKLFADGTRAVQTSTTNIGAYLWSTVSAEKLGIISHSEAVARLDRTISTLETMERHEESGQYYNWYDHTTGEKLTIWPPSGDPHEPRLSSVDNGWLAVGLEIVRNSVPELAGRAGAIYDSMDFGFYYVPERNQILFHYEPRTGSAPCCYNTIVSESRIASLIGITKGELPPRHYFGAFRAFPESCERAWTETRPVGFTRAYYGWQTYDGAFPYNGTLITPSWGGSMFEALMPALFVPEETWAPGSWGSNHPLTVAAQIHHGMTEAGYGYWGFSPANVPEGGYRAYGVDGIGSDPSGYPSNNDRTLIDHGYDTTGLEGGCESRPPQPDPSPSAYTNGVVTPHAAFLGLRFEPHATLANARRLEQDFQGLYTGLGFLDSVNVDSGVVSDSYLSLDQGMIMAAVTNALADDALRKAFATAEMRRALRPVMGVEEFNNHPRGCTVTGTDGGDVLHGTASADVICGLGGDDVVIAAGGDDVVFGDAGRDRVQGGAGDDTLYGGEGDDVLVGGKDWDVLSGGPGNDDLAGGPGADHHEGGTGTNSCDFESSGDTGNACGP
jgi:hypothetical protein